MIDLASQLASIEKLMSLMEQYNVDEVCCDYVNIKKSRFKQAEPTPEQLLEQHTKPSLADAQAHTAKKIQEIEPWLNEGDK